MRIFIQSNDYKLWLIVKNGCGVPMKKVGEVNVPKTEEEFTDEDCKKMELKVRKVLRSLSPKWRSKVDAIEEGRDFQTTTYDALRGNLITYETTQLSKVVEERNKRSIALPATTSTHNNVDDEDDDNDDTDLGLFVRKFKKMMLKKGAKKNTPPKCYGCGEIGHIKSMCPKLKNEKDKKEPKKQRAYISWENDGSKSEDSETEEVANLCLMAIEDGDASKEQATGELAPRFSLLEWKFWRHRNKIMSPHLMMSHKKMELNAKAINMIYCGVNADDYRKISRCETAKQMWEKLEVTYEGTAQTYTDRELVRKVLRSLSPKWRSKVDAIEEGRDFQTTTYDALRGNLITYETTQLSKVVEERNKRSIALPATTSTHNNVDDEDDDSDDTDLGLFVRKFKKMMLKKGAKKNTPPKCYGKAYDSVSWKGLFQIMEALKFPKKFVTWIQFCVTSAAYSIRIDGEVFGHFKGGKGLRQGDPVSPLLFTLVMEYLTIAFSFYSNNDRFKFHPRCKALKLINIVFADDLIVACKAEVESIECFLSSLRHFKNTMGLVLNYDKSQVFLGGDSNDIHKEILKRTRMSKGAFPFRYL
ncbi:unnamed protein product [Cuscuta campestris]|uniref:CCHC-type domain-containing protein n=1 Tax=Cuscuta campestris TaxID=132261 RepID=A0A484LMT0_9ASTE|nr:unnamed protein product [Cuscuta campestris]